MNIFKKIRTLLRKPSTQGNQRCMSQPLPNELCVILISKGETNCPLQVDCEQNKDVILAWRSAESAMAWVKYGGLVAHTDKNPGGHSFKVFFLLPDGSRRSIGEIRYFSFPTSAIKEMTQLVCLEPAAGSVKGTLVRL